MKKKIITLILLGLTLVGCALPVTTSSNVDFSKYNMTQNFTFTSVSSVKIGNMTITENSSLVDYSDEQLQKSIDFLTYHGLNDFMGNKENARYFLEVANIFQNEQIRRALTK